MHPKKSHIATPPKHSELVPEPLSGYDLNYDSAGNISSEVLRCLRDGDIKAYDKVFFMYCGPVLRFLSALIGSKEDAEEICQEVFIKLWENRERIDPKKNIRSFLYTVARNESFDFFRHRKTLDSRLKDYVPGDDAPEADEILVARETELLIKLVVGKMPKQRRRMFELSRYEGLNNDEIARIMGVNKNTVERQISFALKDIRKVLHLFIMLLLSVE